ncbi:unnamed protein product [Cunninghamella echinulata]
MSITIKKPIIPAKPIITMHNDSISTPAITNEPKLNILQTSKKPILPEKNSNAASQSSISQENDKSTDSVPVIKSVSHLTHQFNNKVSVSMESENVTTATATTNNTNNNINNNLKTPANTSNSQNSTNMPSSLAIPSTHSNYTEQDYDDPFDVETSDLSSCDSDDVCSDNDSDTDNTQRYIRQVQEIRIPYNDQPVVGERKQRPPPPPPPSKKYHGSVATTTTTTTTATRQPSLTQQIDHTITTAPISIPKSELPHRPSSPSSYGATPLSISPGTSFSNHSTISPPPVLPPRPSISSLHTTDTLPQLPPRPSTSTLARSQTLSSHDYETSRLKQLAEEPDYSNEPSVHQQSGLNLKRSQTFVLGKRDTTTAVPNLLPKSNYPDFSKATRNAPVEEHGFEKQISSGHRSHIQPLAASGLSVATGHQHLKVWETYEARRCIYSNELAGANDSERIRSLSFIPTLRPSNEGRYVWVGMQSGCILQVDTLNEKEPVIEIKLHTNPVTFILRRKNLEVWTLDDDGVLAIWPLLNHYLAISSNNKNSSNRQPDIQHHSTHFVMPKVVAAMIVDSDLWCSNERSINVYQNLLDANSNSRLNPLTKRIPNDLGNITQLVTIPFHSGKVFVSHDDGKISMWDEKTLEKIEVYTVSLYGICTMVTVGSYYLWTAYNTGMIYIFDTRPEKWLVVKAWRAHHSAIASLIIDDKNFIRNEKILQVVSADAHGNIAIWDGLMVNHWKDQQLIKQAQDYCTYKPAIVRICSWNIDANKPEKIIGQDSLLVHEWLGQTEEKPDIIVVGIQEIVDLESKKQTAKSLFVSRKKIETLNEADELLTHRYRLWHDYLINVIQNNFGPNSYTVIKTDQLVGLFSCIFVKKSEYQRISCCDATVVKTGLKVMNKSIHGNKGGIAIRFFFDDSSLCFVNCHLAAGQSHTQDRNADAEGILQSATFPVFTNPADISTNGGDGSLIIDHEHSFLSGDLNYRIDMNRKLVLDYLKWPNKEDAWKELQTKDQLLQQYVKNPLFKLLWFNEPVLKFDPTYKYDRGKDQYDSSEKKRVPAWCDRVLYRSNAAKPLSYKRHEVKISDHRPISATYEIQVKKRNDLKRDHLLEKIEKDWFIAVESVIKEKKTSYIADFEKCTLDQAYQLLQEAHWDVEQVVQNLFQN